MSFIQLSTITPSPDTIIAPSIVNLGFTLSADKDTPIVIYYTLKDDNNIYFQLSDGSLVKKIPQEFIMPSSVKTFSDNVLIKKTTVPPAEDHSYCFIYVRAVNKLNKLYNEKYCMITL